MTFTLGKTRRGKPFAISSAQRATHMHVIGASGRGKSKFLEYLIRQDIIAGHGLCLIDPHGTLYEAIVRWCATHRLLGRRKIRLFNPTEEGWCFGFNPLQLDDDVEPAVCIDALVKACAQVWGGEDTSKTPLLKKALRCVFYSLALNKLTLLEAIEVTSAVDRDGIRRFVTEGLTDQVFRAVWQDFNALSRREFVEQFSSTNNRLMEFLAAPIIRTIVGQRERVIDFRRCMDEGEIVLVNLSQTTKLSADNARLLGTLIVNDLFVRARGRPEGSRPFYLYIDECYHYLNEDIENILDQARKFGLHAILSHQRLGQLRKAGESVYNAVMGGAQTKVVFGGLDAEDARMLAENIFLGEFNLEEPKHTFDKPTVVDHVPEWLESEATSETTGTSWTDSTSTSQGTTDTESSTTSGDLTSEGTSSSSSDSAASAHSQGGSTSLGVTHGRHQTLRPVLKVLPSVGYSLEELMHRATARLVLQPKRSAIAKAAGARSCRIKVPRIEDGFASAKRIEAFRQQALAGSDFASPLPLVEQELDTRRQTLLASAKHHLNPEITDEAPKDPNFWLG